MSIKRYSKLLLAFFKFSLKSETEFRANLVFWSIEDILWMIAGIIGVHLIFGQVNTIASWTKNEAMLLLFISGMFHDLCWTLIFRNLGSFSHLIRKGELDYQFLKPVNLRFLLSFKTLEFDHYPRIALEIYLIYKYVLLITGSFSVLNLILFLFLFICGFLIFYSLFFALTAVNTWFINLANLIDFFHNIKDLGAKPVYIFKKGFFVFFVFIIPVAYIATFPAEALLGRINYGRLALAPFLALVFLFLSQKFFNFALRHYSSASS